MADFFQVGLTLVAVDKMSRVIEAATGKSIQYLQRVQEKVQAVSEKMAVMGTIAQFGGHQLLDSLQRPIAAFADLEDAQTRAEIAFLTKTGVDTEWAEISKVAERLGMQLPGTTRDFTAMAARLKELGLSSATIAHGGLEATAYLRVLMGNLAPEAAAELTATFKQSLGIMDNEFVRFVDEMQKAKFAFGLDPQLFADTLKYIGPIGKQLGLIGLEGSRSLFPLTGMLSQAGIKGEQLGTSLRATLLHLPELEKRLESPMHKSGEILAQAGITLEFFRRGRFLGMEHFVAQLQKLQRLDVASRLLVLKELFGEETASALAEVVGQGLAGYHRAQETLAKQADLQERLNRVMGTFRNLWEAFTGTLENVFARMGGSIGPELKALAVWLNNVSDAVGGFMERHPALTKALMLGAAATGVLLIASGSLLITLALLTRGYAHLLGGLQASTRAMQVAVPWMRLKAFELWRLIGAQRFLAAIEYRGGYWQAVQYWLMTSRYRMLEWNAAMREWITTTAGNAWQALTDGAQALARWTTSLWRSIAATVLSGQWWKTQAVTVGQTVWQALIRATTATWGLVTATWAWIKANLFSFSGLGHLAKAAGSGLVQALKATGLAIWGAMQATVAWTGALLANPIFWLGVVLAGVALLIWKYWQPIANFFLGFWQGLQEGAAEFAPAFAPLLPLLRGLGTVFSTLLSPLRWIWNLIARLFAPVEGLGSAGQSLGVRWGKGVMRMLAALLDLPVKLFTAGAELVLSLWRGIASVINKPYEALKGLVEKMRALLPFSPAKAGPLRDLHRIRLVETIAEAVRPAPLVTAMQRTAAAVAVAAPLAAAPALAAGMDLSPQVFDSREVIRSASSVLRTERERGAPLTIHYTPTITLGPGAAAAGAGAVRDSLREQLRADADELARLIEEAQRRRDRRQY